ncbi:MAG: hypothetical protein QXT03_01040 [Desulfurococcaceae archaeon]
MKTTLKASIRARFLAIRKKGLYIDFWIRSLDSALCNTLVEMGYSAIVVEKTEPDACRDIVVFEKKVIEAFSRKELLSKLKGVSRGKYIVSVKPRSVESARVAARDSRVDSIILDGDSARFIDKHQFNLMKQFHKPLEFSLNNWFRTSLNSRVSMYRVLYLHIHRYGLPLITSSGASAWNEAVHPKSAINFLSQLINVPPEVSIQYISVYPRDILVRKGFEVVR